MSSLAPPQFDRIVLVDPGDFTPPYDIALAEAIEAEGRCVRLLGQAGDARRDPLHHGHFYPVLASRWGRRLSPGGARIVKGACHGVDMLRLLRRAAAFRAEIVHFQWSPVPAIDLQAIRLLRRRVPVVLTLHDSNPYQGAASWLMRRGYAGLLKGVDAVVVHTLQAQARVAAIGVEPTLVHRIPHGLLGAAAARPRRGRRVPQDRLTLLQFGKIKPYKGVDLLLEALSLVPRHMRPRLDVRVVGKPYMDTAWLPRFVEARGLAGCVTLRFEFVSDAEEDQLFAAADAIVLPYREIDASGVAMSAIARGVPVLATAIDGFRELFDREGGARLVPPGDAAALAGVIGDWVGAPEQLDRLSEAMRARRSGIPSWREIARLHFEVYAKAHSHWAGSRKHQNGSSIAVRHIS